MAEGALDKLFFTRSPLLLGRQEGDGRKTLVEGVDLAKRRTSLELLTLRRRDSYLFLRYSLSELDRNGDPSSACSSLDQIAVVVFLVRGRSRRLVQYATRHRGYRCGQ